MAENMTREQKIEHLKKEISITESLVNDLTAFRNEYSHECLVKNQCGVKEVKNNALLDACIVLLSRHKVLLNALIECDAKFKKGDGAFIA